MGIIRTSGMWKKQAYVPGIVFTERSQLSPSAENCEGAGRHEEYTKGKVVFDPSIPRLVNTKIKQCFQNDWMVNKSLTSLMNGRMAFAPGAPRARIKTLSCDFGARKTIRTGARFTSFA